MSKHHGYMIGKQRLSRFNREGLMRLVVHYHTDATKAHERLTQKQELIDVGAEVLANTKAERDREARLASDRLDHIGTLAKENGMFIVNSERDAATIANLKLALETRKALHAASKQHGRRMFCTLVFVVGIVLVWALSR